MSRRPTIVPTSEGSGDPNNNDRNNNTRNGSPHIQTPDTANANYDNTMDTVDEPTITSPRKSFYYSSTSAQYDPKLQDVLDQIDNVERLITLTLQGIDADLSRANKIVAEKILPTLERYNYSSKKILNNVSHIKEFFEAAANINILTKSDLKNNGGQRVSSAGVFGSGGGKDGDEGNDVNVSFSDDENLSTDEINTITTNIMQKYNLTSPKKGLNLKGATTSIAANNGNNQTGNETNNTTAAYVTANSTATGALAAAKAQSFAMGNDSHSFSEPPSELQHLLPKSPVREATVTLLAAKQRIYGDRRGQGRRRSPGLLLDTPQGSTTATTTTQDNARVILPYRGTHIQNQRHDPNEADFQEESTVTGIVRLRPRRLTPVRGSPALSRSNSNRGTTISNEIDVTRSADNDNNNGKEREGSATPKSRQLSIREQYESPPWEEPPVLASAGFLSPAKPRDDFDPTDENPLRDGGSFGRVEPTLTFTHQQQQQLREQNERERGNKGGQGITAQFLRDLSTGTGNTPSLPTRTYLSLAQEQQNAISSSFDEPPPVLTSGIILGSRQVGSTGNTGTGSSDELDPPPVFSEATIMALQERKRRKIAKENAIEEEDEVMDEENDDSQDENPFVET
ncbi:unnamed protein product [Ambrosiozyma monospora]|uniref:DASH complex subunit ASK1 n=1 Tax=Ambrosiozyma monospora TaxID=43982 RepID=A0A9W6Z2T4_AMBMO|nr:unnamed protein product [Ambrosiozyma monospora]